MQFRRRALALALISLPCLAGGCGQASGTNLRTVEINEDMKDKWDNQEAERQEKRRQIAEKKNETVPEEVSDSSGAAVPLRPGEAKRKEAADKRKRK